MITIPFIGSKRNRVKEIEAIIKDGAYEQVIEPFGGSGVISVNAYNDGFITNAIINDYDHFFDDYGDKIELKYALYSRLNARGVFRVPDKKKLEPWQCEVLQEEISKTPEKYWRFLSSNYVFSGKRTRNKALKLKDFTYCVDNFDRTREDTYYNIIKQIKIEHGDYHEIIDKYANTDRRTLWIFDPPYLNSSQKSYDNTAFFGLYETFELVEMAQQVPGDYILFNMVSRDLKKILELEGVECFRINSKKSSIGTGDVSTRDDAMAYVVKG